MILESWRIQRTAKYNTFIALCYSKQNFPTVLKSIIGVAVFGNLVTHVLGKFLPQCPL
jgi:hypothetical protein